MSIPLLPCPFCGKQPESAKYGTGWCITCSCVVIGGIYDDTEAEATEKWNRRAPTQPEVETAGGVTDTQRLDWLESQNFSLERQWNMVTKQPGGVRLDITSSEDHWKRFTARECIDAAMLPTQSPQPKEGQSHE